MSVTQQQVLDALAKVMSPRGVALPHANVLSEITASDGKVFFSINVDAAEARAWESVRAAGRSRGARHSRRQHGDDRAHRRAQGRLGVSAAAGRGATAASSCPCRRRATRSQPQAAAGRTIADVAAGGNSGCRGDHRGRLRQGRGRQIDHRDQRCAGPARPGPARRPARCGYLRAFGAAADRHPRKAAAQCRAEDDPDRIASACRSCRSAFWSRKTPR